MRLQPRRVKPKIKLDGRKASAYTSRMPSTIDTTGARAESIAHDATLYVWAAVSPDEDAIVRSPKLVISTPAGDVSVQYSTRSGCFSVQALELQVRGLRGDPVPEVLAEGPALAWQPLERDLQGHT